MEPSPPPLQVRHVPGEMLSFLLIVSRSTASFCVSMQYPIALVGRMEEMDMRTIWFCSSE